MTGGKRGVPEDEDDTAEPVEARRLPAGRARARARGAAVPAAGPDGLGRGEAMRGVANSPLVAMRDGARGA